MYDNLVIMVGNAVLWRIKLAMRLVVGRVVWVMVVVSQ
jgi:hypothetical protein